jgi:hypothetical protein
MIQPFVQPKNYYSDHRKKAVLSFGVGLAAGLAFSARYTLIPIFLVGLLFYLIELIRDPSNYRDPGLDFAFYGIGFLIPAGMVVGHNLLTTDRFLPSTLPLDKGFWTNLLFTAKAVFGNYFSNQGGMVQPLIAGMLLFIFICISVFVLRRQHRMYHFTSLENRLLLSPPIPIHYI